LPRILNANVAEPRDVRYLARNAPPRTLEEKTEIHYYQISDAAVIHLAVSVSPDSVVDERTRRTKSLCRLLFLNLEHERMFAGGCALAEERHVDFDCAADAPPSNLAVAAEKRDGLGFANVRDGYLLRQAELVRIALRVVRNGL